MAATALASKISSVLTTPTAHPASGPGLRASTGTMLMLPAAVQPNPKATMTTVTTVMTSRTAKPPMFMAETVQASKISSVRKILTAPHASGPGPTASTGTTLTLLAAALLKRKVSSTKECSQLSASK